MHVCLFVFVGLQFHYNFSIGIYLLLLSKQILYQLGHCCCC